MPQHGGYRRPSQPAAVSGEGANSQRTDTGPSLQDAPSEFYGERAARNRQISALPNQQSSQQGAAPSPGSPPPSPGAGPPPSMPDDLAGGLFEPNQEETPYSARHLPQSQNEIIPENRFAFLEELYRVDPNPDILELLQMQKGRGMELLEHDRGTEAVFPDDPDIQDIDPAYQMDLDFIDPSAALGYSDIQAEEMDYDDSAGELDRTELTNLERSLGPVQSSFPNPFPPPPADNEGEV